MDQYIRREAIQSDCKCNSSTSILDGSEPNSSDGFECNICLDIVQDPVVTLCGHLYCWPCIYRWIRSHDVPHENRKPQCPVCKAEVSLKTLIPLYGRGLNASKDKSSHLGFLIPQRPSSSRCGVRQNNLNPVQQLHNRNYLEPVRPYQLGNYTDPPMIGVGGSSMHLVNPMIGMFGEMVYTQFFGDPETSLFTYPNSYRLEEGSGSPRLRRHMMQNDKSLSRICFFLCCCVMLCLILF